MSTWLAVCARLWNCMWALVTIYCTLVGLASSMIWERLGGGSIGLYGASSVAVGGCNFTLITWNITVHQHTQDNSQHPKHWYFSSTQCNLDIVHVHIETHRYCKYILYSGTEDILCEPSQCASLTLELPLALGTVRLVVRWYWWPISPTHSRVGLADSAKNKDNNQ